MVVISTDAIASHRDCPVGKCPSVSTVKEIATGMSNLMAPKMILIASFIFVAVIVVTMSAAASAKVSIYLE